MKLPWLTGFYEADGAVCWDNGRPRVQLVQSTRCVLEAIQKGVGVGKVYPRRSRKTNIKPNKGKKYVWRKQWVLSICRVADIATFLRALLPHMQITWRKQQARKAIRFCERRK